MFYRYVNFGYMKELEKALSNHDLDRAQSLILKHRARYNSSPQALNDFHKKYLGYHGGLHPHDYHKGQHTRVEFVNDHDDKYRTYQLPGSSDPTARILKRFGYTEEDFRNNDKLRDLTKHYVSKKRRRTREDS